MAPQGGDLAQVVNHPGHYVKGSIEVADYIECVVRDLPGDEAWCISNILKYISRYRDKHPDSPQTDVKKAGWYLNRLTNIIEGKQNANS